MKRKLIAILCVFSMLVGMFYVPTAANETQASEAEASETSEETQFEELTLGHFGAIDRPDCTGVTGDKVYYPYNRGDESLNNVAVTGVYNFKNNESVLYIGGENQGLKISSQGENLQFSYDGTSLETIDANKLGGNSPVDRYVKIRATFSFENVSNDGKTANITIGIKVDDTYPFSKTLEAVQTANFCRKLSVDPTLKYASYDENVYDVEPLYDLSNESGTTADVTFGITVNDTYTTTKTLSGVSTEHLKKTMWIFPTDGESIEVKSTGEKQESTGYTELTPAELGIADKIYSSSQNGTANTTETLDGVAIEGTYTFSGGMSNRGVLFGTTQNVYRGLYMWMQNGGEIVFKYRTDAGFNDVAVVDLANVAVGQPTKIRITFDFEKQTRTETSTHQWGDTQSTTSLKNKAIEGYYKFVQGTGSDCAVSFGGNKDTGISFSIANAADKLNIYYKGNQLLNEITPAELGLDQLLNTELHIRVAFAYINETDVQVGIDIAHKGTFYFILKDCEKTNLSQCIYIYATTDKPLAHRPAINMDYTISDLSSDGADKIVAERTSDARDEIVLLEKLEGKNLIGIKTDTFTVEGYYNFESTGADSTSAVYYGSRKAGICLSPNANHDLEVSYDNGAGERTEAGVICATDAGFDLTNRYIKIKTILSVQTYNGSKTVVVGIIVEDPSVPSENRIPYRKAFKLQNVSTSHLDTVMSLWAKQKVTVSDHILAPTHLVDITLSDFNISDNPTSHKVGKLEDNTNASENKISFDGKLFSADVQFSTGGGWIRLAGKQDWEGIGFGSWGNGQSFQFRKDNATNNPAYTLTNVNLDLSKTGLSQVTDSFNLKISIEFVALESDGNKNDVRYGLYFNDKLYDDQFFYSYNDKDAFGDYLHLTEGLVKCESVTRSANKNIAPYILEDFGVEAKEYKTTDDKKSYKASIQMADTEKNSISGKIALTTYGQLYLYNNNNADNYSCFYFSAKDGGVVQLLGGNNHPQTKEFATGDLNVDPDEEFTFTLTKETLDADSDGLKDDVRLGVWINNQLHKNKYFYFTDLAENMNGCVEMLYNSGNITVKDSIETSYTNLSQEESYQVTGYGNLTVNGVTATHGQIIGSVGDYTIRCTDYDAYIKKVSVFKPGDAHLDGEFTVQDLVAMKKAESGVVLSTKAANKSADYNLNGSVQDDDLDALRRLLLEETVDVVAVASYTFEDNVMPIMGGTAPYRTGVTRDDGNTYTFDLINDNSYRLLKEAGINLITSGSGDFFSRASDKMCLTA